MRAVSVFVCLAAIASARAGAAPAPPCKGCTLDVPAQREAPMPLLVVLHGDRERAPAAAARWRAAAARRGWVLLSLQVPDGDSWWKWNGDPAWLVAKVADVAARVPIDPAKIYLAGWSGGATYIGMRAPAWPSTFAAVVVHGGGHRPGDECPDPGLPAYMLVGDKNPLHYLMVGLREYFTACRADLVWDLVKGGDHDREERALTNAKALAILDWLAAHARG